MPVCYCNKLKLPIFKKTVCLYILINNIMENIDLNAHNHKMKQHYINLTNQVAYHDFSHHRQLLNLQLVTGL